ncbi:MAG: helix-turn-helix transcriptional regulator [Cyanobacteriota bacterium]
MITSRGLSHRISRRSKTRYRFAIKNNLEFSPELATLKQLRERLGMTQEELATELGTTSRTIRRHETGERQIRFSLPQIKRLIELMQRAGMSSDDLPDDIE